MFWISSDSDMYYWIDPLENPSPDTICEIISEQEAACKEYRLSSTFASVDHASGGAKVYVVP